jgi:hypothetical protein
MDAAGAAGAAGAAMRGRRNGRGNAAKAMWLGKVRGLEVGGA